MRTRSRLAAVAAVVAAAVVMAVAPTAIAPAQASAHQPVGSAAAAAAEMNDRTTTTACVGGMNFKSAYLGAWVLANPNWYYILQARADRPLFWESFAVCKHDGYWTIKADVNGKYVTTNLHDQALLVASSNNVGLWERFTIERKCGDRCVYIRSWANNQYVYADPYSNGTLRATTENPGLWERFIVSDTFPF